jgi:hypothetical protein
VPVRQLFQLGQELMQRAERVLDEEPPAISVTARVAAARDYRDALMICLLAARPPRVKNLLQIEIGSHLRQSGSRVTLHFEASETKTHRAHDTVWPESLGPALQRYVAEVRPMLCGAVPRSQKPQTPHAILWVAQGGSAMTYGALSKAIDRHTIRRFGHPITAHLSELVARRPWATEILLMSHTPAIVGARESQDHGAQLHRGRQFDGARSLSRSDRRHWQKRRPSQ